MVYLISDLKYTSYLMCLECMHSHMLLLISFIINFYILLDV